MTEKTVLHSVNKKMICEKIRKLVEIMSSMITLNLEWDHQLFVGFSLFDVQVGIELN